MRTSTRLGILGGFSLLAALAACSTADDPLVLGGGTPRSRLEQDTQVEWVVELDDGTHTARLAFPKSPTASLLAPGADASRVAADFLVKYPEVFGVPSIADLESLETATESSGAVHALFAQKANGVVAKFARIAVHFDSRGGVDHVSGPFYPDLARVAAQPPAFDEAGAMQRARAALAGHTVVADGPAVLAPSLDRATYALRLMYTVPVTLDGSPGLARIDALTGVMLDFVSTVLSIRASGKGADGTVHDFDIDTPPAGQPYAMQLTSTDRRTSIRISAANPASPTGPVHIDAITSPDLNAWEGDAPVGGAGSAVDVMAKLQVTDAWFRAKVGRLSYDGKQGPLLAYVYAGDTEATWPKSGLNAVWLSNGTMAFTVNAQKPDGWTYPYTQLDVVAHELMHGITEHTSGLYYGAEPGALNESMSDIFGQLVDRDNGGDSSLVAEEFGEGPMRSMKDPAAHDCIDHVDRIGDMISRMWSKHDDNGGVHLMSGIPNLAWYLMTEGGSHPATGAKVAGEALGYERSRQLWWTLNRFELKQFSSFRDAATKSLLVARYQGLPRQAIGCAWQAVGVLSADELRRNYDISCEGPDAGTESVCKGKKGLVSFCHPDQANAAVVCRDEAYIELTICPDMDDAGPISPQKCVGTDGVLTTQYQGGEETYEADIRCETVDPDLDTCVGKADGWYCSEIPGYEFASYSCVAGQRTDGQFCTNTQRCDGFDGQTIRCAEAAQ